MDDADTAPHTADALDEHPSIRCEACRSALESPGRDTVSFLLLDQLTIPLVGCETHLEQFRSVCGLTSQNRNELLGYPPAGGLPCPGCRNAAHSVEQPILPLDGGALAVLTCASHRSEIVSRFQTGLETQRQLTTSLDGL